MVFYAHVMMLPPQPSEKNATAVAHPLMYATHLAAEKEASQLQVTTKCVKNSYTFLDNTSRQKMYGANPSSARAAADQRGG